MALHVPRTLRVKRTGAHVFILWKGKPFTTLPGKSDRVPVRMPIGDGLAPSRWGVSVAVDKTLTVFAKNGG